MEQLAMMISPATMLTGLIAILGYLTYKHQALSTSGDLQEEIEKRLQPKYPIDEPSDSAILPHTDWPSEDFYFEVWHVEVHEAQWMRWKKWLPWGRFRGSTIVYYDIHGHQLPSQEKLHCHHLARQPYVRSIEKVHHDPEKIKVIYESVDPSNISLFVSQFKYLIRNVTFHQLNPEVDLQYEMVKDDDGNLYAHFFDANRSKSFGKKRES